MQCESLETKQSIRKSLVQQVEEQSDLCDVTIKIGHWEKKFHRCVLVVSPFFNQALTGNFLEKETAKVKMTIGTPASIEMAILFLYGRKPKLTEENIRDVLMLAEFLLIPKLKIACISWLNTVKITEKNCLNFLQLASIYDFEITGCVKYITSHLTEMLHEAQMENLSKDSVKFILSEKKLSYVSIEDKLRFLIKWTNSQPAMRKNYLRELFELIDFQEVSKAFLEELKDDHNVVEAIDLEELFCNTHIETCDTRNVLIMKAKGEREALWCLYLEKENWFRVDIAAHVEGAAFLFDRICGTSSMSQIFFTGRKDGFPVVSELNLKTDTCLSCKLVKVDDGNNFERLSNVNVIGDMFIACENLRLMIDRRTRNTVCAPIVDSIVSRYFNARFETNVQASDVNMITNDISILYIGHKTDDVVKMYPLLTFKNDRIANMCMNNMLSVAILFRSRKVVAVLDLVDNTIETIRLETKYNDELVQSRDGFVIYNHERCISLTRMAGPCLKEKYKTRESLFIRKGGRYFGTFVFCEDTWYHYYTRDFETYQFESASHSEVMSNGSTEGVVWKHLLLPREQCYPEMIKGPFYQICLPKSKLRCHTECPHCKKNEEKARYTLEDSSESNLDEPFSTDSSDDDSDWQHVSDDDSEYVDESDSD